MAAAAVSGKQPTGAANGARPSRLYFAYGSNLHLKQMKRRCPNSKYIGHARLSNYRWQINERGYANVIACQGYWVEGLVYEIDEKDEAKLDINEGVSKNAYAKRCLTLLLHRAQSTLYRRPVSWIVDKGGPANILQAAKGGGQKMTYTQQWKQEALVYISIDYVENSKPKDEYVDRINLGLVDARALGMAEDYILNCIRPFIPEAKPVEQPKPKASSTQTKQASQQPGAERGIKRSASPKIGEPPSASKKALQTRPDQQALPRQNRSAAKAKNAKAATTKTVAPPLPPRPIQRFYDIPIIWVEEEYFSGGRY